MTACLDLLQILLSRLASLNKGLSEASGLQIAVRERLQKVARSAICMNCTLYGPVDSRLIGRSRRIMAMDHGLGSAPIH